jgi:hypothetical protein
MLEILLLVSPVRHIGRIRLVTALTERDEGM